MKKKYNSLPGQKKNQREGIIISKSHVISVFIIIDQIEIILVQYVIIMLAETILMKDMEIILKNFITNQSTR